ncbi:thioesterase family protein [Nocardioides sp. GXZ039]|uniref:thioesterase family protein n=1 Tax=Nocardioides sp. GXZ039 TaxID=3136018 RepID=UPI0030F3CC50
MSVFDDATTVTRAGDLRWTAELSEGWGIGSGLNGGYLLATIARALSEAVPGKPDPLAISAHYLSASHAGPAGIDVTVLRDGGSVATTRAELRQGDDVRIAVLATLGDLDRLPADDATTAAPPDLPPVGECVPHRPPPGFEAGIALLGRFDLRLHPDHVGWTTGQPDGSGVLSGWFRLEDERDPDPLSLLLVVDALPPVTFTHGLFGWAPTLELTAYVRARPAPGWLRVTHATRSIAGGMFEEDCEVWDSAGRLVAQSRQLARTPRPHRG